MAALVFIPLALCIIFFLTGVFIDHKMMTVAGYGAILILLIIVYGIVYATVWMPLFKELYRHA